jgi:hypothetical protein
LARRVFPSWFGDDDEPAPERDGSRAFAERLWPSGESGEPNDDEPPTAA